MAFSNYQGLFRQTLYELTIRSDPSSSLFVMGLLYPSRQGSRLPPHTAGSFFLFNLLPYALAYNSLLSPDPHLSPLRLDLKSMPSLEHCLTSNPMLTLR